MVKWHSAWLSRLDGSGIEIMRWAQRVDDEHFECKLCHVTLKYTTQGFQSLFQHSLKANHKTVSKRAFSNVQPHFAPVINVDTCTQEISISSSSDIICSTESTWLFKVAEEDYSFRFGLIIPLCLHD